MPRRVGARSPRGAARLPPRADPGRREYLARRGPQEGCGRRILRRSRQSRGRADSHAAPSPSRMAPARAQLGGRQAVLRVGCFIAAGDLSPRPGAERVGKAAWTQLHPRLAGGQSVVVPGPPSPVAHSGHTQASLSFGYLWTFSGLRPRGKHGWTWIGCSP